MTISAKVLEILRTWQRQQAGELLGRLGVSRPSLMRAITELQGQVVSRGRARRTAYAARRAIRGNLKPLPFYRVDEQGQVYESGLLEPTYPAGCAVTFAEDFPWPLDDEMRDGWFRGLPYPFGDMRTQGYLGRNFAHQFAALMQVDETLTRWSEDDVLHVLSLLGSDQPGNYIIGEQALRRFLNAQQQATHFLKDEEIEAAYPTYAMQALNFGIADSSVAGEFPKFTARRWRDAPTHVIVKFSGADDTPQERRWADLLICEHLALTTISDTLQVGAASSRIYQFAGRTFYEVDRFDRHGEFGRSGVCSWHELNAALFGGTGNWSDGSDALLQANYISEETAQQIRLLAHFGRMIGNTDMHDGNLAFLPNMRLAPAYDMLPMMYAPQRGVELIERKLNPALPLPNEREILLCVASSASVFWRRVEADTRISLDFRRIAGENAELVDRLLNS